MLMSTNTKRLYEGSFVFFEREEDRTSSDNSIKDFGPSRFPSVQRKKFEKQELNKIIESVQQNEVRCCKCSIEILGFYSLICSWWKTKLNFWFGFWISGIISHNLKVILTIIHFPNRQIFLVCFIIAFAFAAPAPSDETITGDASDDVNAKTDDLKQILLLLKPWFLLG